MSILWTYFWPCFGAGLLCGVIAGIFAFRAPRVRVKAAQEEIAAALATWSRRRRRALVAGALATCIAVALWHGPLGAADRLAIELERSAREMLVAKDAPAGVTARIRHGPLTRQVILSGPADDFQRAEAARLLSEVPGISDADWNKSAGIPLIVEGIAAGLVGFLIGLVLAYLVELRRRHNSQWTW
jgi:membrane protease YdiL (CAAX protease family)